jgi:hypothetical protein
MPKKKRPPRPGQFGAAAAAASEVTAKRSKAAEQQKSGTQVLRVLVQDKGAAGNSIAETARSVGQAARQTAHQAAAQRAAEALTPALIDELLGVLLAEVAEEVHEWDLEQDYLVKVEVQRMLIEVVDHVWGQEQQEELLQLYCAYKGPLLRPWRATDTVMSGTDYRYLERQITGISTDISTEIVSVEISVAWVSRLMMPCECRASCCGASSKGSTVHGSGSTFPRMATLPCQSCHCQRRRKGRPRR